MKSYIPVPAIALPLLALSACGGPGEPVARLSLEPSASLTLPYPGRDRLEVMWKPLEALDVPPHVFVHVIDQPGNVLRTFDHPFPGDWSSGREVESTIGVWQSALAPPLAPGNYELTVGLYNPENGRRWPLQVSGREVDQGEYAVARVEVPPPSAEAEPEIDFSEGWLPLEPTGDRQLFAVRWLGAEGGWIALTGLSEPTTLALTLHIPRLEGDGFRLLLDEGVDAPRVTLTSECSGELCTLEGLGRHEVELTLAPPGPEGRCAVHLEPQFVFLDEATFARRTLLLEKLLWDEGRPAPAE